MEITVESGGKKSSFVLEGPGLEIMIKDIIPSLLMESPNMKGKTDAEIVKEILSELLKGFVRQRAKLW